MAWYRIDAGKEDGIADAMYVMTQPTLPGRWVEGPDDANAGKGRVRGVVYDAATQTVRLKTALELATEQAARESAATRREAAHARVAGWPARAEMLAAIAAAKTIADVAAILGKTIDRQYDLRLALGAVTDEEE